METGNETLYALAGTVPLRQACPSLEVQLALLFSVRPMKPFAPPEIVVMPALPKVEDRSAGVQVRPFVEVHQAGAQGAQLLVAADEGRGL